jgi:hypothetical protein
MDSHVTSSTTTVTAGGIPVTLTADNTTTAKATTAKATKATMVPAAAAAATAATAATAAAAATAASPKRNCIYNDSFAVAFMLFPTMVSALLTKAKLPSGIEVKEQIDHSGLKTLSIIQRTDAGQFVYIIRFDLCMLQCSCLECRKLRKVYQVGDCGGDIEYTNKTDEHPRKRARPDP